MKSWSRWWRPALAMLCLTGLYSIGGTAPAWSAPPEIQNLIFTSDAAARWDADPAAVAYHVYRGSVSDLLSGSYGACHRGSVVDGRVDLAGDPPVGTAGFYLVSGFDASGEGSLGISPAGLDREPAIRCLPARRLFALTSNGAGSDGVEDGVEARGNPHVLVWNAGRDLPGLNTATGELSVAAVDLVVPGRGLDWSFSRTYRSQISYDGPLGRGWDFADNARLTRQGADVIYFDGTGRREIFTGAAGGGFDSPPGLYGRLIRNPDGSFTLRVKLGMTSSARASAERADVGAIRSGLMGHSQGAIVPPPAITNEGRDRLRIEPTHKTTSSSSGGLKQVMQTQVRMAGPDEDCDAGADGLRGIPRTEVVKKLWGLSRYNASAGPTHVLDFAADGRLESIEDRQGNRIRYLYDHQNLLTQVVDTLGRTMSYSYLPDGHVESVTDHTGRTAVITFDGVGHGERRLVGVRSPVVTGTPNGNDFAFGKTTTYSYSGGFSDPRLNDNLERIVTPEQEATGQETLLAAYGSPGTFEADRVLSLTIGGTNSSGVPAGGSRALLWDAVNPGADPTILDLPRRRLVVTDPNGNEQVLLHNASGQLLSSTERTNRDLRPGEPDYTKQMRYNADGELVRVDLPGGNSVVFTYDTAGPDRYRRGNLLEAREVADPLFAGGRGDGHGGELNDRVWTYTYEPLFNQVASMTGPKGNDPSYIPPNGGPWAPERYRWQWFYDYQEGDPATNGVLALAARFGIAPGTYPLAIGDLNGDGRDDLATGNRVREEAPAIRLDPGSHQAAIEGDTAQEIITLWRHNSFGQIAGSTDPAGNTSEVGYHPEADADGDGVATPPPPDGRVLDGATGGLVAYTLRDTTSDPARNNGTNPPPVAIRNDFEYDAVGRVTGVIDGRGVRTRMIYNALDQIVELRPASATAAAGGPFGDPPTGRGEGGLDPVAARTQFFYDADDRLVRLATADADGSRGVGPFVETTFAHDLLGRVVRSTGPVSPGVGLTTEYRYDPNGNLASVTRPAGNVTEWAYDERDLLLSATRGAAGPLGGAPSTEAHAYDPNGNLVSLTDPEGDRVDLGFDGHDRRVRRVDKVGGTIERFLDPDSDDDGLLERGTVGGPTPTDRSGSGNVDLADTRFLRDEIGRAVRVDRRLFLPAGAAPVRPAILVEGDLVPGDGYVNRAIEYDPLSRPTFETSDSAVVTRRDYDGADRLTSAFIVGNDSPLVSSFTYDPNGNLVEIVETERSSSSGPPPGEFLTTHFFDALDRRTMTVDNLGQTHRFVWDTLDDLVVSTDPNGPPGGTIARRSPGHAGTAVAINGDGNATVHAYDGIGRRIRTSTGNAQEGVLTVEMEWSVNGDLSHLVDARGNESTYQYDNLDRVVGATADDGTFRTTAYDRKDNPVTVTDANSSVATHAYDPAGRRTQTTVARAPGVEGTTLQAFEYDGLSRLTRLIDNNEPPEVLDDTVVRFVRDSLGRLVEEGQRVGSGGSILPVDGVWRAEDLLTRLFHPSGYEVDYTYDAYDRLVGVADASGRSVARQQFAWTRVHTLLFDNGLRTTTLDDSGTQDIGHDGARRTVLLRHLGADPLSPLVIAGFEYRYDRAGNRLAERRLHHPTGIDTYQGTVYAYDSANRMIEIVEGSMGSDQILVGPATDSQSFTLDGAGNWALMQRQGVLFHATPNNNNEYDDLQSGGTRTDDGVPDDFLDRDGPPPDGLNLAHDRNGNQTDTGPVELRYDFMNRPVRSIRSADGTTIGRYAYDALGRFVWRQVPGPFGTPAETRYVNSLAAGGVVEERDELGAISRRVIFMEGEPLWQMRKSGDMDLLLRDDPGSVVALADAASPAVAATERVTYDAYGKPTFETPLNLPKPDAAGNFAEKSDFENTTLFRGMRYDHECGSRTNDVTTDLGGFYAGAWGGGGYYNPNQGRRGSRDNHLQGAADVMLALRGNAYAPTLAPVNGSGGVGPWLGDLPAVSGFISSTNYRLYSVTGQPTPVGESTSSPYKLQSGFIYSSQNGFKTRSLNEGNPWLGDIAAAAGFTSSTNYRLYSVTGQPTPVGEAKNGDYKLQSGFIYSSQNGFKTRSLDEGNPWLGDIAAASGFTSSTNYRLYSVTGQPTPVGEAKNGDYKLQSGFIYASQPGSAFNIIGDFICCGTSMGYVQQCCNRLRNYLK